MHKDDDYGFQQVADAESELQQPPSTAEAYPVEPAPVKVNPDYSKLRLVNPRQKTDAQHVQASSLFAWFRNDINELLGMYYRNPSPDNSNLIMARLMEFQTAFIDGRVWVHNAHH